MFRIHKRRPVSGWHRRRRNLVRSALIGIPMLFLLLTVCTFSSNAVADYRNVPAGVSTLPDQAYLIANAGYVSVLCDGIPFYTHQAMLLNSTTFVPVEAFLRQMGYRPTNIRTYNDGYVLEIDGRCVYCSCPCQMLKQNVGGSTGTVLCAPIRAVASTVNAAVAWDPATYTVSITGGTGFISEGKFYPAEDLYWLSRIIEAESGAEPFLGKIAVGNVVLNRVREPSFPSTVKGVIFDRAYGVQFTPTANGSIYRTPSEESIIAAKLCLEGYTCTEDALFFLNESLSVNPWAKYHRTYVFTIGRHTFYA